MSEDNEGPRKRGTLTAIATHRPTLQPSPFLPTLQAYTTPHYHCPIDLKLDSNEGQANSELLQSCFARMSMDLIRHYPKMAPFEAFLAERLRLSPERVMVTAGGDDGLDRIVRSFITTGREAIVATPSFEMLNQYIALCGGTLRSVPWLKGPFPLEEVLALVNERTALISIVSPNNPTGSVATAEDVRSLAKQLPRVLILLDLAYCEFADEDLTHLSAEFSNIVVVRTLSKAWGLAGLRVGYIVGEPSHLSFIRKTTGPYMPSSLSLFLADSVLRNGGTFSANFIDQVKKERVELTSLLQELGAETYPSQANFVLLRHSRALWIWDALQSLGIAVRTFAGRAELKNHLRITCPGNKLEFMRLCQALRAALTPEALLFDMDGVLADVSLSYREAIRQTAASFGVTLSADDITRKKQSGNANNDWVLTSELLAERGTNISLAEVTKRFEELYQGSGQRPGLREQEQPLVPNDLLEKLSQHYRLGIVTGRPRDDAQRFLKRFGMEGYFSVVVCLEDAPLKPSPAPVRLALDKLDVASAWLFGDTPDDLQAARAAGVIPVGVVPPGENEMELTAALRQNGAADVITTAQLQTFLI